MANSTSRTISISSDDEDPAFSDYDGGGAFDDSEGHDWLSELLGEANGDNDDADSDEVVFLSQSFPKTLENNSTAKAKLALDDDDDDCVVLDCDPEKPVLAGNGKDAYDVDGDDDDDVEIVGEKGEVACRDFPHSRHLCGMHLFASTPHEVHCSLCHCYVCDSIAPCDNWGTGMSSIDHCHATDKEEYWRAERKSRKEGDNPISLISPISNPFVATEALARAPPQPNHLLLNPTWRPTVLRPCSVPSNHRITNVVNPGRCYPAGRSIPRYKPQQQLYPPELPPYNSHGTSSYATTRSPRFYPSRVQFKRTGFRGDSQNNRFQYFRSNSRSQISGNPSHRRSPAFATTRFNGCRFSNEQGIGNSMGNSMFTRLESSFPPNIDVTCSNYISCPPQIQSPLISSFHLPIQPNLSNDNFVDVLPSQSHVPPPILTSSLSDAGSAFEYHLNSTSTVTSHPNLGNTFENQSYQPDAYDHISPFLTNCRNEFQLSDQNQSGRDTSAVYFGSDWHVTHSHMNSQASADEPQLQSPLPADSSHNQRILELEDYHHQNMAPLQNYHKHHVAPAPANSSLDASNCHFSGNIDRDQLDAQFESWMFANPSSPVAFEGPRLPYWHSPSPETDSVAAGTLFNI